MNYKLIITLLSISYISSCRPSSRSQITANYPYNEEDKKLSQGANPAKTINELINYYAECSLQKYQTSFEEMVNGQCSVQKTSGQEEEGYKAFKRSLTSNYQKFPDQLIDSMQHLNSYSIRVKDKSCFDGFKEFSFSEFKENLKKLKFSGQSISYDRNSTREALIHQVDTIVQFIGKFHGKIGGNLNSSNFIPKNIKLCSGPEAKIEWNQQDSTEVNIIMAVQNNKLMPITEDRLWELWGSGLLTLSHPVYKSIKTLLMMRASTLQKLLLKTSYGRKKTAEKEIEKIQKIWQFLNPAGFLRTKIRSILVAKRLELYKEFFANENLGLTDPFDSLSLTGVDKSQFKKELLNTVVNGTSLFSATGLVEEMVSKSGFSECEVNVDTNKDLIGLVVVENDHTINICMNDKDGNTTSLINKKRNVKARGLIVVSTDDTINIQAGLQLAKMASNIGPFLKRFLIRAAYKNAGGKNLQQLELPALQP